MPHAQQFNMAMAQRAQMMNGIGEEVKMDQAKPLMHTAMINNGRKVSRPGQPPMTMQQVGVPPQSQAQHAMALRQTPAQQAAQQAAQHAAAVAAQQQQQQQHQQQQAAQQQHVRASCFTSTDFSARLKVIRIAPVRLWVKEIVRTNDND